MNKTQRKTIQKLYEKLSEIRDEIDMLADEEREKAENLMGIFDDRADELEESCQNLEEARDSIDEAMAKLDEATGGDL